MKRVVVVCAVGLALGGCIMQARHEREIAEADTKEAAFCESIGARPNTSAYTDCRLRMRQELIRKQAAEKSAVRGGGVVCSHIPNVATVCN